jgi:Helix-turn-helix domain
MLKIITVLIATSLFLPMLASAQQQNLSSKPLLPSVGTFSGPKQRPPTDDKRGTQDEPLVVKVLDPPNSDAKAAQGHFRAVTSLTPIQYQKQVRLQEARAKLLTNPRDVAAVGYAVGYDSPSQFSREYRRLFGAPPGRDTARLLGTSVSASQT